MRRESAREEERAFSAVLSSAAPCREHTAAWYLYCEFFFSVSVPRSCSAGTGSSLVWLMVYTIKRQPGRATRHAAVGTVLGCCQVARLRGFAFAGVELPRIHFEGKRKKKLYLNLLVQRAVFGGASFMTLTWWH